MGEGQPDYTEFLLDSASIAGGQEMQPMVPAQVPSYWLPYFTVADVDGAFRSALGLGAQEMVASMDFPGGRFAILQDPQGATFGLLKTAPRQGVAGPPVQPRQQSAPSRARGPTSRGSSAAPQRRGTIRPALRAGVTQLAECLLPKHRLRSRSPLPTTFP